MLQQEGSANNSSKTSNWPEAYPGKFDLITPLDFTRNQEYPNDNVDKDAIEKILEYYI